MRRVGFHLAWLGLLTLAALAEFWPHLLARHGIATSPRLLAWGALGGLLLLGALQMAKLWRHWSDREHWI